MIGTVLLVAAVVFAALATANVPSPPRFAWLPAAILCWLIVVLLGAFPIH